jgi:hypothetical protein
MTLRWRSGQILLVVALAACTADAPSDSAASTSPPSPQEASQPSVAAEPPSPEEEAAAAATEAFTEMLRVTDAASREPALRDWEPEIRRFAADPAAFLAVQSVRDLATLGLRQEGDSVVDVEVTAVDLESPEGPTVRLTGCYDSQSARIVDVQTGEIVPPGTPPHYVWNLSVVQYIAEPEEPWLVTVLEPRTDQPC